MSQPATNRIPIAVAGDGFAGLCAAVSAARRLPPGEQGEASVTLISRDPYLTQGSRLYEASLERVRIPLASVLDPAWPATQFL